MLEAEYRTVPLTEGDKPGTLLWGMQVRGDQDIYAVYDRLLRDITQVDIEHVHLNITNRNCLVYCWVAPIAQRTEAG